MKIQSLIVSLALWIPMTLFGAPAAASPAQSMSGASDPVYAFFLRFLLPRDFTPDPLPARIDARNAAGHRAPIKLNGHPAPSLPLPDLDASVQLVVGPLGAPSQGTIVHLPGEGYAIITHDHFNRPALDERDDLYYKEHGEPVFTGHVDISTTTPDATRYEEVNIISLSDGFAPRLGSAAEIASPATIAGIEVGDWVQVVYNAGTDAGEFDLQVVTLQVTATGDTTIQVYDPGRLINRGDSGGAVYFNGELIGVLWSIGEYGFGPAVNVSILQAP